jgi:site-specific DNA-methyltransferase (adenine-specific)
MVEIGSATLYHGDCREILPSLRVDSILTDPPYSQRTHSGHDGLESNDGVDRRDLNYGYLTPDDCRDFASLFASVCDGWTVWMTDHTLAPDIQKALENEGRYVFAPLPYYAPGSRVRLSGDGPSSWTDWIIVSRTAKQCRWGTLPGGYLHQPGWNDKRYIGGKPTGLMKAIVNDYTREGDLVCDPFMGSGTTGEACIELRRRFIGIERDNSAFNMACERLARVEAQGDFFRSPQQQEIDA